MSNPNSLRSQTLRIVISSLLVLMGGVFVITSAVIYRSFTKLERELVLENMLRIRQAFENIRETLESKSQDWANWDDTYQYLVDQNQKYAISNLNLSSLAVLQVNHVMLLDVKNNEVFRISLDFNSGTESSTPDGFLKHFRPNSELLQKKTEGVLSSGVLMVSQEPVVFVARSILTSHGQGPSHGTLIFAQTFNHDRLKKLSEIVKFNLKIIPFSSNTSSEVNAKIINFNTIAGYCPIYDVFGRPSFVFYTEIPRNIFKQAQLSSVLLFGLLLLISLIFTFVVFFYVDRLFLQRLITLSNEVSRWNSSRKIELQGNDELSQVADKINEMLDKIKESQKKISEDEKNLREKDKEFIIIQQNKVEELENINKLFIQRTKELERMHLANLNILEDFREAKKQAEAASEAKSQFLANMSHEIRTPLNAILGFTDLLQRSQLDDKQRKYLDTVMSSGRALLLIVSDILEISKAEAKKIVLDQVDFNLVKTCQSAFDIVSQRVFTKSIDLKIDISNEIPEWVKGDPARLTQILINILGNAVKFTQSGSISLVVSPEEKLSVDGRVGVKFQVRDTGIGIEKEKLQNIFKIFTQVDGSTTRKFGGVGLGLAIAKNLANLMGGDIQVESEFGSGSVFTITTAFLVGKQETTSIKEISAETGVSSTLRILVVEDSVPNQQLIKAYFKVLGVIGEYVNNGQEAVNHLKNNKDYMMILMDMQMPVMGGCEATNIIRREVSTDMPIIALTASASQEDQEDCLKSGMNDFLTKPLDINKLKDVIKRYAISQSKDSRIQEEEGLRAGLHQSCQEIGLDFNEYKELLKSAVEIIDQDKRALVDAIAKEDHPSVKVLAHKFKGTLGNLRLKDLSQVALAIEELANKKSVWNLMLAKEKEFEALVEKLRKVIG